MQIHFYQMSKPKQVIDGQVGDTVKSLCDRRGVDYTSRTLAIRVNNQPATLDTRINDGDVVTLTPPNIEGGK